MEKKFALIGGDLRIAYLAEELTEEGNICTGYGLAESKPSETVKKAESMKEAILNADYIITPVPFSRNQRDITNHAKEGDFSIRTVIGCLGKGHVLFGGGISPVVKEYCMEKQIPYFDFMEMEGVSVKNAVATAEGSIAEAIKASPVNLHGSKCLILGYGRCGKILADKLMGMKAFVTVAARKEEQLSLAYAFGYHSLHLEDINSVIASFAFIFNTIPSLVLPEKRLKLLNRNTVIIDIASKPGGTDFEAAKELGLEAKLCLGLPGIYAPKTSASILAKAISNSILEFTKESGS